MVKLLNILVVAYLAIAPAMNVEALIHSVNLCAYTAPQTAIQAPTEASHCGHDCSAPDTTPDTPEESEDCPHFHQAIPSANVMPVVQLQSFDQLPCPALTDISTSVSAPACIARSISAESRPPPGPGLVGTTILLV